MKKIMHVITGYCAFNKGVVPPIKEISFEKSKKLIIKRWGGRQDLKKCKIIIYEEDVK